MSFYKWNVGDGEYASNTERKRLKSEYMKILEGKEASLQSDMKIHTPDFGMLPVKEKLEIFKDRIRYWKEMGLNGEIQIGALEREVDGLKESVRRRDEMLDEKEQEIAALKRSLSFKLYFARKWIFYKLDGFYRLIKFKIKHVWFKK